MALREAQVLGTLERHRSSAPPEVRVRYAYPISLAERRMGRLQEALVDRGGSASPRSVRIARGFGRLIGCVTGRGHRRRVLSSDIEGIQRLGDFYHAQYKADPPDDIRDMLAGFLQELEAEMCTVVAEFKEIPPPGSQAV